MNSNLKAFAKDVLLHEDRWCLGLSGPQLQRLAIKHGLVTVERLDAPCSDRCLCERRRLSFPRDCCQWTAAMGGDE